MKHLHLIASIFLFCCLSLKAEERPHERVSERGNERIYGQIEKIPKRLYERVHVHTDKDCYLAGEDVWLKFYAVNSNFQPSHLSKVGYVEICDTEKPQMQLKIALEEGHGSGKIKIPVNLPSGIYRLSGYTRYMRNEGKSVFFKKQIAIINAGQQFPDPERFEPVEKYKQLQPAKKDQAGGKESAGLRIKTDRNSYGNRRKVLLSLENIPGNMADLVVSVSRNDSIVSLPAIDESDWRKQVTDTLEFSGQWIPEYEGHIVTGRFVPEPQEKLLANLALVGNDIRYTNGQLNAQTGTVSFYTAGIFGKQQAVTSAIPPSYEKLPYRVDLLTPFDESLPLSLPVMKIYPDRKTLLERYTGVQIREKIDNDSLEVPIRFSRPSFFQPSISYDLDEYTRFATVSETILEFIKNVSVNKVNGKRTIGVYSKFGLKALVLLDGIPVYDHEDILRYNPMFLKKIDIYNGYYTFGDENFEYIVSFVTHEYNLPFYQLSSESQLFSYDFPQLPSPFEIPDYSIDRIRNSGKPDFRHTLYWNPSVTFTSGNPVNLFFYTSDLCGEFKVSVEGITTDGEIIRSISRFQVIAAPE